MRVAPGINRSSSRARWCDLLLGKGVFDFVCNSYPSDDAVCCWEKVFKLNRSIVRNHEMVRFAPVKNVTVIPRLHPTTSYRGSHSIEHILLHDQYQYLIYVVRFELLLYVVSRVSELGDPVSCVLFICVYIHILLFLFYRCCFSTSQCCVLRTRTKVPTLA